MSETDKSSKGVEGSNNVIHDLPKKSVTKLPENNIDGNSVNDNYNNISVNNNNNNNNNGGCGDKNTEKKVLGNSENHHFYLEERELELHRQCHKRIFEICNKPLSDLPVGKDLPRLARKFFLFQQQDPSQVTNVHCKESTSPDNNQTLEQQQNPTTEETSKETTEASGSVDVGPNIQPLTPHIEKSVFHDDIDEFRPVLYNNHEDVETSVLIYNLMEKIYHQLLCSPKNSSLTVSNAEKETKSSDGKEEEDQNIEQNNISANTEEKKNKNGTNVGMESPGTVPQASASSSSTSTSDKIMAMITSPVKPSTSDEFPSLEEYKKDVNSNDHQTITDFLLKHFGEAHPMVRILKACHQTIIINVLYHVRIALMAEQIQFKDVRGQWKLFLYFPSAHSSQSTITDKVLLAQRRRELVYIKRNPSEHKSKSVPFKMFENLFQMEWEIRIWFQREKMDVYDVTVHLLDIIFDDPQDTLGISPKDSLSPEEHQKQVEIKKKAYSREADIIRSIFDKINIMSITPQQAIPGSPAAGNRVSTFPAPSGTTSTGNPYTSSTQRRNPSGSVNTQSTEEHPQAFISWVWKKLVDLFGGGSSST